MGICMELLGTESVILERPLRYPGNTEEISQALFE